MFCLYRFVLVFLFAAISSTTFGEEIRQIRSIFPLLEKTPEDKFVVCEGRSYAMAWNRWVWENFNDPIPVEMLPAAVRSGGTTTTYIQNREAFSVPLANLDASLVRPFALARQLFRKRWAVGHSLENQTGSSVGITAGLGPIFNRSSCSGCHLKDGRGHPPRSPDEPMKAMIVRLSISGIGPNGGPLPHPDYGTQLQNQSIPGVSTEGRVSIRYREIEGIYSDGQPYSLRKPTYEFSEMSHGLLDGDT